MPGSQIRRTTARGAKRASSKAQPLRRQCKPRLPLHHPNKATTQCQAPLFGAPRHSLTLVAASRFLTFSHHAYLYCFLDFVSIFTAFRTSRPSLLLFGLRVQDFASRTSCPSLPLFGLRVHLYRFSDFASIFTAFRTSRPGFRVRLYCFSDFASIFTAFRTPRPSLLFFGLRVHLYRFSDFASIFIAFRTSRPSLPLFGLRVQDFVSIFIAFRTSRPGLRVKYRKGVWDIGPHVMATPSHVHPSRVPGKVDTPKPRCI
ncbi:hypothetical protein CRG98_010211 [Punica granatum]|uniref:Uncharacterized protein n=1 Tax=Punica granatum TaxID=22663 RepID=A0A2I0KMC6_PUNGR|nr:hypothetical protein CRG98_010211 [Punica granatum]